MGFTKKNQRGPNSSTIEVEDFCISLIKSNFYKLMLGNTPKHEVFRSVASRVFKLTILVNKNETAIK